MHHTRCTTGHGYAHQEKKATESDEEKAVRAAAQAAGEESPLYSCCWLAKPVVSQPTEENLT